ncbi:unnamed protein product [Owenia fusiformis]|uniref:NB-ARC domain-containing protein n=1 Tax=Owenia fusiformis TaxID=6347 RepID=A0A8S4Q8J5_OWEFU|nr:unnamed protein product [Owenia fusiformis]
MIETADFEILLQRMEKHKFAIITGMSGIGKTEMAKLYWHLKKDGYNVGWNIKSNTDRDLKIAATGFIEKLDSMEIKVGNSQDGSLSNLLQNIRSEISKECRDRKRWNYLLIFDDAGAETKSAIEESFNPSTPGPSTSNISVILTTQQSFNQLQNKTVNLGGLSEKEVLKFWGIIEDGENEKNILELWEEMSHLPSALKCAKHYIKSKKRSIEVYLKGIKDKTQYKAMETRDAQILGISYDKTPVCAHVEYAKAMIEEISDKPVRFVLKTMGFLDSKAIPEFLLREILRQTSKIAKTCKTLMMKELVFI